MRLHRRAAVLGVTIDDASVLKVVSLGFVPLRNVEAQVDGVTFNGARRENLDRDREWAMHTDEQGMFPAAKAAD